QRQEGVERRAGELGAQGRGGQVQDVVAEPHPHPGAGVGGGEDAVRKVVEAEAGRGAVAHRGASRRSRASRSSRGSVTEQEPKEVNQRRTRPRSRSASTAPSRSSSRA